MDSNEVILALFKVKKEESKKIEFASPKGVRPHGPGTRFKFWKVFFGYFFASGL